MRIEQQPFREDVIVTDTHDDVTISKFYQGLGIECENGSFGLVERDGGFWILDEQGDEMIRYDMNGLWTSPLLTDDDEKLRCGRNMNKGTYECIRPQGHDGDHCYVVDGHKLWLGVDHEAADVEKGLKATPVRS